MKKNHTQNPPIPAEKRKPELPGKPKISSTTDSTSHQEDLHRNLVSSLIDGALWVSTDHKIVYGNLAAEEMFGHSRDRFKGSPVNELFPDQPEMISKIDKTLSLGLSFRDVECMGYKKSNQTLFPVNISLSPYSNIGGHIEGCIMLVRDMSLLKELEETGYQSDHMSTLGVLSLGMAHEIKNPLGGIRGSAQLLYNELNNAEFKEYLEVIMKEVDRINRMVEHMLNFAQPQKLELKESNIHKILENIIALEKNTLAEKKGTFITDYDPSIPMVDADEDKLTQVFFNLIRNAVEISPKGKNILVITRISRDFGLKPTYTRKAGMHIVVEIIDNGPGILKENLKKIFTPFYTTKNKGSGLGLPISLKIVEDHLGKIKFLPRDREGTTVQVYLPIRQGNLGDKRD